MGKRFAAALFLAATVVGGMAPAASALARPWDSHRVAPDITGGNVAPDITEGHWEANGHIDGGVAPAGHFEGG
ncbi:MULTISPECIES: hypothetical protein [unclassified Streptomyces]|uniref:hypothetical protein n=1 Tax=unclassified Streptomyces TaxID=2593676 RepID=UPI000F6CD533|nr:MULTISPECIES: hypothetical protein [unclassified Streptomyces]AZM59547.1 hypothetical protein DLM49_08245 [Streptomyces sp. WAC 01438]RSM91971.1 hypothetical protein DMA10_25765 [Streptomyces sp. WAC 01420]